MNTELKRLAIRSIHPETIAILEDLHGTTRMPRNLLVEDAIDLLQSHYSEELLAA